VLTINDRICLAQNSADDRTVRGPTRERQISARPRSRFWQAWPGAGLNWVNRINFAETSYIFFPSRKDNLGRRIIVRIRQRRMQINTLKDFLIVPSPTQPIISELDKNSIRYLFKTVNGKKYLITVNPEAKVKKYKFPLPEYRSNHVELLFDANSSAKISDRQVEETMPPMGVKIYLY